MRQLTILIITALLLLTPVLADDKPMDSSSRDATMMTTNDQKPADPVAAGCPMAGKAHNCSGVCTGMKTADGSAAGAAANCKMKAGCCNGKEKMTCCAGKDGKKCPVTGKMMEAKKLSQTKCPVMGENINRKHYVDHGGKRVYVCCPGCIGKVKADPDKYIKMLEDEGVELETVES